MRFIRDPYTKLNTKTVVALGCFDGVHIAHRQVISEAVRIAGEYGCEAAVWCFSEPPKNFYSSNPAPLVCDETEKKRLVRQLGVDILISPHFDGRLALVEPEEFVCELLCECAGAVHLVCGKNYTFGHGGRGNTELLSTICASLGIGLYVVDDVSIQGIKVSSTLTREAVEAGQCIYAQKLLGREFSISLDMHSEDEGDGCVLSFDRKYLAPFGRYRVLVSQRARKKECIADIERTDSETLIHLPFSFDSGRTRVTFLSNKMTEHSK